MEKTFISPALLESESSTEFQKLLSMESNLNLSELTLPDLVRRVGLKTALKSRYTRFRYLQRLWLLRETRILQILCDNYDAVPRGTPSKVCAFLLKHSAVLRSFNSKVERNLKQRLIVSPFRGLTTNNKETDKRLVDSFKESHNIK